MRKNTKVIVWSVVISFALWGAYSVGTQFRKEGRIAGEAFGKEVTFQEFDSFHRASQIFTYSGQTLKDPEILKQHAWQSLLYSHEAKRRKIQVSDDEIRTEILRLLSAQKIENPSPDLYRRWLQATIQETPQVFEGQVRELLRIQKLIQAVQGETSSTPPTPEEAHKKFQQEQNSLSADILTFPSLDEAKKFHEKVPTFKQWKKETAAKSKEIKNSGLITLGAWIQLWNLREEDALALLKIAKDGISNPLPLGSQYALFHIVDKTLADESKFEKEFKQKYLDQLREQRSSEKFLKWSLELREKAKLKDYLPHSQAAPAPQSVSVTPAPPKNATAHP